MEKVRTALIGVGTMGKKYAEMICKGNIPKLALTAAVCRNEAAREWVAELDGNIKIYESSFELFENSREYDAVIIATPHKSHPELAMEAFKLGKHVMCDKPAGISAGQAVMMSKAAEKSDKIYAMMFHQRMYPKYLKIKELLNKGGLGNLKRIMMINSRYFRTAHYHKSGSWRSSWNGEGGGALINQGQHLLDIWQWLFGMPEKLYADIPFGKYNDFKVDDEATIHMKYKNGLTAVFMLTTGEAVYQERLEITGSRGKILLEEDRLHIWRYSEDCEEYIKRAEVNSRENLNISEEIINFEKSAEPYAEMLNNFAEAVIEDKKVNLVAKGEDAVNSLMLTNAAYCSAWKGEAVTVPIDMAQYDRMLAEHCEEENDRG